MSNRPDSAFTFHPSWWSRRRFLQGGMGVLGVPLVQRLAFSAPQAPWRGGPFDRKAPEATAQLLAAVLRGDTAEVRRILRGAPDLGNARDSDGRSIFVLAHLAGHSETAAAIAQFHPPADLVESILAEDSEKAAQLAQNFPEQVNAPHPIGGTAYFTVGLFGRKSMVFLLDRWGGDPNANPLGAAGMTAARAALECADPEAGEETAIRILVNAGDVNAPQKDGDSILHAAARRGSRHLVRLVLRRGGRVDALNRSGRTPLAAALEAGNGEAADVLRNQEGVRRAHSSSRLRYPGGGGAGSTAAGLDPLVINEFGAVCHFNFDRVKELVAAHPAVVHANAGWNEMGVEASAHMGRPDMVGFLLERGAPLSLPTSVMMGESERCRELLAEDPERIRERGPHDFALMWYPQIAGGRVDLAQLLLDHGADLDEEKLGVTLLHRAAYWGQAELVDFLLARGARTDGVGRSDFSDLVGTPLDFARARQQEEIVKLLEAKG